MVTLNSRGTTYPYYSLRFPWQWGSSDAVLAWQQQQERAPQVQQLLSELKSPEQIISRLKKRIAEKPNEVQGWFLLGRLYMSQNRFIEAAAAFVKAEQLQPNDPTILFQHAEAEFYQQNQLTPPVENLLQRVLQQIPDHPGAINLLALHAYQTQHYAKAIQLWRRLLAFYPPDSEDNKMLLMAIERAKSKIGQ